MDYTKDNRTVMTLDAGGTNFVFSAYRGNKQIIDEITLPSNSRDLDKCLATIVEGFNGIKNKLNEKPAAISFAFPGPADYRNGIIGDLQNLPAFKGGVALGPYLKNKFDLPVFINNDGDLYAYGEAIAGFLPYINNLLESSGNPKRFHNLLGLTIGTGFGAGIVNDGRLYLGDNSIAGEIWLMRDKLNPSQNAEEHVSIRGIRRDYAAECNIDFNDSPEPKVIYEIAAGIRKGNRDAALKAFSNMATAAGDAIANAVTLADGLIVIGGGLSGAHEIFLDFLVKEMNGNYVSPEGSEFKRLAANVYNLEKDSDLKKFLQPSVKEINIYGTDQKIAYDYEIRTGIGISKIGTSKAISIGAYAFALSCLDGT